MQTNSRVNKRNTRRIVFVILALLWMFVIFLFSAKNADESTEQSLAVGMRVGSILHADFETWSNEARIEFAEIVDKPIRKMAHMAEYALLGVLLVGAAVPAWDISKKYLFWAWLIATVYACSDEVHQLFVPGRYGSVIDVGIDAIGAFVGVVVGSMVLKLSRRNKKMRWPFHKSESC